MNIRPSQRELEALWERLGPHGKPFPTPRSNDYRKLRKFWESCVWRVMGSPLQYVIEAELRTMMMEPPLVGTPPWRNI